MQLPGEDDDFLKKREEEQREREAFIKEAEISADNVHRVSMHGGREESVNTRDVSVMSSGV